MSDLTKTLTFEDILNMMPEDEPVHVVCEVKQQNQNVDDFEDMMKKKIAPPPTKEV